MVRTKIYHFLPFKPYDCNIMARGFELNSFCVRLKHFKATKLYLNRKVNYETACPE